MQKFHVTANVIETIIITVNRHASATVVTETNSLIVQ